MKWRQAMKILKRAGKEARPGYSPYGAGQIERSLKRVWHSSRYPDGPRKGQRMLAHNTSVRPCMLVLSGQHYRASDEAYGN